MNVHFWHWRVRDKHFIRIQCAASCVTWSSPPTTARNLQPLFSKFKMGHSNGAGSFHPSESTSCRRKHRQKVEERGKKRRDGESDGVLLISLRHSALYNELQLWLQIKTEGFFFYFSSDYLQSGAWVEVWSQQRRERGRTMPEREEEGERKTGKGKRVGEI